MKEFLERGNYKKIKTYIDVFKLSGIVKENGELKLLKIQKETTLELGFVAYLILSLLYMIYMGITFDLKGGNNISTPFSIMFIGSLGFIYPYFTLTKKIKKYHKKRITKIFGKLLKDNDFKTFINEYYQDIKNKKLSKKETISFIKNWEKNKSILTQERKDMELERLNTIISVSEKDIKEAKEKLKEIK